MLKNTIIAKNKDESTPIIRKGVIYLSEQNWFLKKFEREIKKTKPIKMASYSSLKKSIHCRRLLNIEDFFLKYEEPIPPEDIQDIVWEGPPLKCCFCISSISDCDCKGDMALPPHFIPFGHIYNALRYFDFLYPPKYEPFALRLQDHLTAEAEVQEQLLEKGVKCSPVFCVYGCYHNRQVLGKKECTRYYELKRALRQAYKKKQKFVPKIVKPLTIADERLDGFYRTGPTQATTDENGEFVISSVTKILFPRKKSHVLQDIEGTPYSVSSYQDDVKEKSLPVVKKIEDILSISGIKSRVSKLTSNLMSSIIEIKARSREDEMYMGHNQKYPGIPKNTRATQDPSLDKYIESVIVPSKYIVVEDTVKEVCPCCKKYKELHAIENDRMESNVMDNYDDFISKHKDPLSNTPSEMPRVRGEVTSVDKQTKKADNLKVSINKDKLVVDKLRKQIRKSGIRDDDINITKKQKFPPKDNQFNKGIRNSEIESEIRSDNDNIELLKQNSVTNKGLYAIQSESMINVDENSTIKINERMNSLEFLESIKPCCIDNLYNQLEQKISDEKYIRQLVEDIYKEFIYALENINLSPKSSDIEPKKKKKAIDFLKSTFSMKKFSEFIKKQKSSLKNIISKNMKEVRSRFKNRKTISLQDFKLKLNKSFKKLNKAVSSFCKQPKLKINKSFKKLSNAVSSFFKRPNKLKIKESFKKTSNAVSSFFKRQNKLKIKESFKKFSKAVSSFFKGKNKKSSNDVQFRDVKKDIDEVDSLKETDRPNTSRTLQNIPDARDSKTSEKEVFSLQYNSTWEFNTKNNNQ